MSLEDIAGFLHNIEAIVASVLAISAFVFSLFRWVIPSIKAIRSHINVVERISEEFKPNGGSSLKDAIDRLERSNSIILEDLRVVKSEAQRVGAKQWALVATQKDPVFETDESGSLVRVNVMYSNLMERSIDELRDYGWENSIHPEDREVLFAAWEDSIKKHKSFELIFKIVGAVTKKIYHVNCIANPYFNTNGEVLGYIGRFVNVELMD